jgi:hypothetical protein
MNVDVSTWSKAGGWQTQCADPEALKAAGWVLYFAASGILDDGERFRELRERYPNAILQGCSTGGEIYEQEATDETMVVAAVRFERTAVYAASTQVDANQDSRQAGRVLGEQLRKRAPTAVFVLSDGTKVNGTELVAGLRETLGAGVVITGGLAGDGARFGATRVGIDQNPVAGTVSAVALAGSHLLVGHGSAGGWEEFGPERVVTKSEGNVLLELDHKPALELYKQYLGDEASRLPSSALLYPLVVRRGNGQDAPVVRTIVGVDESRQSMTFAGDIPEGSSAKLMRASIDQLVDGATTAAEQAKVEGSSGLAVLVSCIGRKLLMGQRTSDEVEAVAAALGNSFACVGFYSYGEISPLCESGSSELHNQTMTVTSFSEV